MDLQRREPLIELLQSFTDIFALQEALEYITLINK